MTGKFEILENFNWYSLQRRQNLLQIEKNN